MHRKWLSAALVGAAFMVAGATVAPAQETLKIGGIGPLSGGGTAWGLAAQRGIEIAIEEINAAGGFKAGGKTYKLELIMYDDQYTGAGGKAAAERLVNQDKVKFIVGPVGSPPALGAIRSPSRPRCCDDQRLRAADPEERHQGPLQLPHLPDQHRVRAAADQVAEGQRRSSRRSACWRPTTRSASRSRGALAEDYRKQGFEVDARPLRARHQGVHAADPAHDGAEGRRLRVQRQFAGRRRPDAEADPPGRLQGQGHPGRRPGGPTRSSRSPARRPRASSPTRCSTGIRRRARSCGRSTRRSTARASSTQFMPAFYHTVFLLVDAIKRADSVDTTKVRDALETIDGYDAGIYGPVKWTGKDDLRRQPSADVPLLRGGGEGRQARHQGEVHDPRRWTMRLRSCRGRRRGRIRCPAVQCRPSWARSSSTASA